MIRPELVHPGAAARGLRQCVGRVSRFGVVAAVGRLQLTTPGDRRNAARDLSVITAGASQAKNSAADG